MPRKKRVLKRQDIGKDFVYGDIIIARLMNQLMWSGKKAVATTIVYSALDSVKETKKEDPLAIFKKALENIKPIMEVRSRRIGGANYQVPIEVRPTRKLSLGLKWLIEAARKRGEKTMSKRLAAEILEALENKGNAVKKKEETHRMAEANRAFAHYRW